MGIAALEKDLIESLEGPGHEGYFTAAFLECGLIMRPEIRFRYQFGSESDVVFDLASLSKALVTAPLVYLLQSQGKLRLKDCLGSILSGMAVPEFLKSVTLAELLAHQSGLPAWTNFWSDRMNQSLEQNFQSRHHHVVDVLHRLKSRTGARGPNHECYSDIGFIVLGLVVECLGGKSLESLFDQTFVETLGLKDKYFVGGPNRLQTSRLVRVATGYDPLRDRLLVGEVHDENCYALGGFSGHAGLFGSGRGLARMLRWSPSLPFWDQYLTENLIASQSPKNSTAMLGLRKGDDPSSYGFAAGEAVGHLGFTGTAFWLDLRRQAYAILLTNRVISGRRSHYIRDIRARVFTDCYKLIKAMVLPST